MSLWYVANKYEILCDLDDYMRPAPSKTGEIRGPWGEVMFRRRLGSAMRDGKLAVLSVYLDRSNTEKHWHAIVRLKRPMTVRGRLIWQQRLGSDLMRSTADMMRAELGIKHPSLLIRSAPFTDFYREPDYICRCTRKHDTREQYELGDRACAVWRKLRGMTPYELFGVTFQGDHRGVALPVGEVPLELILRIDETKPEEEE